MKIPVQLEPLQTPVDEAEYKRAFEAMQRDHVDGVMIGYALENYNHRHLLGRLAQQYHLPAMCAYTDTVESCALMSYTFDHKPADRRLAAQIVEILNGGNPAEMPYFQETHPLGTGHQPQGGEGAWPRNTRRVGRQCRQGDRISGQMSAHGTFETCRRTLRTSGVGGRPEVV